MHANTCILILIAAHFLLAGTNAVALATEVKEDFELLILHNNDMHARFEQTAARSGPCIEGDRCYGGFARIAHLVREARQNESAGGTPVLYLNAGDTYQGTPWYTLYKWNITYMMLNKLAPDAMSLGNHEFDDGVQGLLPFLGNVKFPVLACNLNLTLEPRMKREKMLMDSVILEKNGLKIGVIGYLTPDTKILSAATEIQYFDEVEAVNKEAKRLKSQNVQVLIALGHSGFETDCKIAAEVPDIDLVIGGHTNTFLWNGTPPPKSEPIEGPYPKVIKQKQSSKMVPVVQAYAYTKYLGRLMLRINSDGELISFEGQPILLDDSIPQDEDVLNLIDVYKPGVEKLKHTVIASTVVLLDGVCRKKECNLGNVIADSMVLAYTLRFTGSKVSRWSDTSIALISGGGIRSTIDAKGRAGNVTMEDLMTVLPFGNDLLVVRYKGSTIKKAFERSVYRYNGKHGYGEFLQMSGVRVVYNVNSAPGSRVVSIKVLCTDCDIPAYELLDMDKEYNVILNAFLTEGGDDYTMLKTEQLSKKSISIGDLEAAQDYLANKSPIHQGIEGRITFVESNEPNSAKSIFGHSMSTATVSMLLLLIGKPLCAM